MLHNARDTADAVIASHKKAVFS